MRKKLVSTLLVGAVAATSVIGLSACGGLTVNSGVKVTEEEWKSAIEASVNAENYTVDYYYSKEASSSSLNLKNVRVNVEESQEFTAKTAYDKTAGKFYTEKTSQTESKAVAGSEQETKKVTDKNNYYVEYGESENWLAKYRNYEESGDERKMNTEIYWAAESATSVTAYYYGMSALKGTFATSESALIAQSLSDLYESFEYNNGMYTATLYRGIIGSYTKYNVTLSIKDGYVVGYQTESVVDKKDGDDYEKSTTKTVYNFSNYGKTSVKAPRDAVNAIEKAKKDA